MIRTLTVVGGGSAYAPGLIAALIHHERTLALREVRLHDLDQRRLEIVAALGRRMAEAAGVSFTVRGEPELIPAIRGADAVLNSARPGGFECRRLDETLPLELGLPGQETVGPGGFFFALRSIPQALALAEAMAAHAPGAVLLNYTNPTNLVTQAIADRAPHVRALGLCDQSDGNLEELGVALGRHAPFDFTCVGLNHATWYSDIRFGGEPLGALAFTSVPPGDAEHQLRFRLSGARALEHPGWWPNSYVPYYTDTKELVALMRTVGPRTDAILEDLDGYFDHFREESEKPIPKLTRHRGTAGFGDMAVRVLIALGSHAPMPLVLNVPNRGSTGTLDAATVAEQRVRLSSEALVREPAPELPPHEWGPWLATLARLERYQRSTAEAALSGDVGWAAQALAENPLVPDLAAAEQLLRRARELYGPRLPLFA